MIDKLDRKIKLIEIEDRQHHDVEFKHVIPLFELILVAVIISVATLLAERHTGNKTRLNSALLR